MKKLIIVSVVALAAVSVAVTAAVAKPAKSSATKDICVLLPDPKSSVRWETQDRPALVKSFNAARVSYVISNANGDAQKQKTQADSCLSNGAKVVILVSLDAGSSIAIEKAAAAKGAKVIEYDRQVKGGNSAIYISFDGGRVGILQGSGVVAGLKANGMFSQKPVVAELNGGQTDNNSYLFKGGYDKILKPYYKSGKFIKGPDQFTPDWDNQKAGTIFEQMLVKTNNKIDAVAAANDGLANAVVVALKATSWTDPAQRSGRDAAGHPEHHLRLADDDGLEGHADPRCPARPRPRSRCFERQEPPDHGHGAERLQGLPAYIIPPVVTITKSNYKQLFNGYLKRSDVCHGALQARYCK